MKKNLIAVAIAFLCSGISACRFCSHEALSPREPVSAMFLGCQKGCGSASEEDVAAAHVQPAAVGDATYCPVSGAVFRVDEKSAHREVGGKTLYFCCEMCAGYFDKHQAEVLAMRGLT